MIINTPPPDPPGRVAAPAGTTVVVAPLARPSSEVAVVAHTAVGQVVSLQAGSVRISELERQLHRFIAGSGASVIEEQDVGAAPLGAGTFVLRLELTTYSENVSIATADLLLCGVLGGITVGLGMLACVGTRNTSAHTMELEARLYDAMGAPLERVTHDGEIRMVVDTSGLRPVLRQTYRVHMQTGVGPWSGPPSGPDGDRFYREQGERLAQLVFLELAPDLERALIAGTRAQEQRAPQPAGTTTGGEQIPAAGAEDHSP